MSILNDDQVSELKKFQPILDESNMTDWYKKELDTYEFYNSIIKTKNLEKRDLTKDDLYSLSEKIVDIFGSTQLRIKGPRSTIESNNLKDFNETLRNLYFSKSQISKRFDNFLNNKRVGLATASAFLCIPNHKEYPYFTNFMYDVFDYLNISTQQFDEALMQAQKEFGLNQNTSELCEEYFKTVIILREVKEKLKLESFFLVQNLLWNINWQIQDTEEPTDSPKSDSSEGSKGIPFGMESTLRDFLAGSPELIEKGFTVVQTEYQTVIGPIDILCKDRKNRYVVVEVKKTKDSDNAIGKLLRYMGAIKDETKTDPRGILIMYQNDTRVDYALKTLNNIELKYYQVKFTLSEKPNN